MQLWASFGTKAFWWPEGGASTPHHAMMSSTIICPTAFFLSSSFLLLCFCCWVLFFGSNPFFCSEPNGTAPRFCPKDFPCPRGTTRKANITGVVCPSGTCTAQDCCVSIYTCVCLGVCSAHSHKPVHALPFFVGVWNRLSFSFSRARLHPSSWHVSRSSIFYG